MNDPPASKTEAEQLHCKIDNLENRSRHNNSRFVGFPEGCEDRDALIFLCKIIPTGWRSTVLTGPSPGADQMAIFNHESSSPGSSGSRTESRLSQRHARRGEWHERPPHNGLPDYSRPVVEMRSKFNQCKKLLHEWRVRFSLMYPAVLVIKTPEGWGEFDDPKKASSFITLSPQPAALQRWSTNSGEVSLFGIIGWTDDLNFYYTLLRKKIELGV